MNFTQFLLVGTLSAGLLTGCGGGGGGASHGANYDGLTEPVALSADNQATLADSSVAVAETLVSKNGDADGALSAVTGVAISGNGISKEQIKDLTLSITNSIPTSNLPVGASQSIDGDCGGSLTVSGNDSKTTVSFSNYDDCFGTVMSGSMTISMTDESNFSATYSNFTIEDGIDTYTISGSMSLKTTASQQVMTASLSISQNGDSTSMSFTETCSVDSFGDPLFDTCVLSESFVATDGSTYRIDDVNVSEDFNGNWDLSGTLFDPENGYVEFEAVDLVLCSDDSGSFQSGTITLTDDMSATVTITFNGCNDTSVTFNAAAQ